ncbi:hexose-6-phosphate:phosphate antiporter [Bacillus sp. ISL-4]|uniref:hexose-6-phosphate:phosphate antiporter n=1 Tax=Bacillus sp. ISL-4 TaxID=2819125 RepID=UPI001BEC9A40|nr:hexose-6-phosphate:phosphate antiporter [Bacillus sp. ISL-4]MBT2667839.1 hexose-6-phosphate:phosphate antiporter [Bacillus sp. ISL-4]MBT2675528.1 hexose-6-phosphate:phosphate antiporter [Streptomyces sp. ISL-14]
MSFFSIDRIKDSNISIEFQRKNWLKQFLKAFLVVFFSYMAMYLIRNNFKAAQPLLKSQLGFSTSELGYIGLVFSITYGIGKTLLGYFIDGRNTKRIISFLLILSAIMVLGIGLSMSAGGLPIGLIMVLWGVSGLFQSTGGPASYSTITRWTPLKKRGSFLGFWNTSHNIGGAIAGVIALWGANVFFNGHVVGMFIFPAIIALIIGIVGLFFGKDDPEELGWNRSEEIFGEPIEKENIESESMSKREIFAKYVLKNPWIWTLCVANVFVYIVRIGIDNWAPLYVTEHLHFSPESAVNTIFYFEIGALVGSLLWGYISDLLKGRRALVAVFCLALTAFAVLGYRYATSELMVNVSLFVLGVLIFGPQLLIAVSIVGFAPKKATTVTNGLSGTFGYLFGDSIAKVGLAKIADPTTSGLTVAGLTLHGWSDTFIVFYVSLFLGVISLLIVSFGEEKKIRL